MLKKLLNMNVWKLLLMDIGFLVSTRRKLKLIKITPQSDQTAIYRLADFLTENRKKYF